MYTLFLDESMQRKQNILGLGGLLVKNNNIRDIEIKFNELKSQMGLTHSHPLKWNLPDHERYKEAKDILDHRGIGRFECRKLVLQLISSLECWLFSSLLEETRAQFSIEIRGKGIVRAPKKPNVRDFYPWAFEWLLQRLYFFLNNIRLNGNLARVIIDKPSFPRGVPETLLHHIYQDAYNNGFQFQRNKIPPLKEYLEETLNFSYNEQSSLLQLADFCIGATVNWAQAKIDSKNEGAEKLFITILPKFYSDPRTNRILGYGIVVYPPQGTLLAMLEPIL